MALVTQPDSASPFALPEAYGGACAPWSEVLPHVAQRLVWAEPTFRAAVVTGDDDAASLAGADAAVFVGVTDPALAARLAARAACVPCVLAFDCAPVLQRSARLHFMPASSLLRALATALPWSRANRDAKLLEVSGELYDRRTPSDLLFLILLVADAAVAPVATLAANKRSGSLGTAWCMARHCASEVAACVSDVACKRTLDCLTSAGLNDQIAAYRCIVSYETPTFEAFSLCVLQKHNCLGNSAERPLQPELAPMASFRGRPLSHETAERLFIGWLDAADSLAPQGERLPFSWLVVAGANPVRGVEGTRDTRGGCSPVSPSLPRSL